MRGPRCLAVVLAACLLIAQGTASGAADADDWRYEGKVSFVTTRSRPGLPRAAAQQRPGQEPEEVRTVKVMRDGSKFTKRLAVDTADPLLAQANAARFAAQQPDATEQPANGRRNLKATVQVAATSTDLSCNGCPTSDTRVQITTTTNYPFSALGELIGDLGNTNTGLQCSGTLISRTQVVTAAHCVFDINDSLQYVSALDFYPGQNGVTSPFGTLAWDSVQVLSTFTSQTSYTTTAMDVDFALITLKDEAPAGCGYLSMFQPASSGTASVNISTAGYPGDKSSGTMWESTCNNVQIQYNGQGALAALAQCNNYGCGNIITHTCLSYEGQSGSGMWDANNMLRAILTGKVETNTNVDYNVGTGLTVAVYNTLATWYNNDTGSSLPTTPVVGDGSTQGTKSGTSISTPWVIAVIAAGGALVLLAILGIIISCCCRRRAQYAGKPSPSAYPPQQQQQQQYAPEPYQGGFPQQQQYRDYPQPGQQAYADYPYPQQGQGYPHQQYGGYHEGLPPPNGGYPEGVTYDDRTGNFNVNGNYYGTYQHPQQPGYQ